MATLYGISFVLFILESPPALLKEQNKSLLVDDGLINKYKKNIQVQLYKLWENIEFQHPFLSRVQLVR